ncbi:hypothetical protein O181_002495 [Austropuccinia psidii MF-1]|uniref:Uncharacterized protein n=1 Tax=Austropuccinia psidii MF-1 TaxID=1389203 RepID=A0A9Q3BD52_9BASI|nr:hypothetical protein [Austropuccinia psidii MF-1]
MVEIPSFPGFEWDSLVIDTPKGEDLILGSEFLNNLNTYIEWSQELITFNTGHKDYNDPSKILNEAFKEIKDVGEDNSIYSLNIFHGNVDLPPSSYHDSSEELCDEEEEPEEIEAMMKSVSSSYHHYLDVFSKVKAEKLPPHCACDNHIELEGSQPPVGVI